MSLYLFSFIWVPPYKTKEIEAIENVQRRATKMLPDMKDLTHEERLRKLKLPSLSKIFTFLAVITVSGRLFQSSTTLFVK
jgi:predicted transcriptional regulator